jgi:hypothetical protein
MSGGSVGDAVGVGRGRLLGLGVAGGASVGGWAVAPAVVAAVAAPVGMPGVITALDTSGADAPGTVDAPGATEALGATVTQAITRVLYAATSRDDLRRMFL